MDLVCELQRLAVNQIYRCAGFLRDGKVTVGMHTPPDHSDVPRLVEEMCRYVNEHMSGASAIHLAAYVMWRLNWIHPFFGGNGRTSRAFSYLVLCIGLGFALPAADKTIPELMVENRDPYYEALRVADAHWSEGRLDLSSLEELLSSLLASQLLAVHQLATGNSPAGA